MKKLVNWEKYIFEWSKYKELTDFLHSRYMYSVLKYLQNEYKRTIICPQKNNIFKAFEICKPDELKVVIIGQDPYPNFKATGLAFANPEHTLTLSPSLEKIRNAVEKDIGKLNIDFNPNLENWANQGVLLLNTALTVQQGQINSHKKVWDKFTKFMIQFIAENFQGTIFMLWGEEAQKYIKLDSFNLHDWVHVLKCTHPSYAARNNIDWKCDHFSKANKIIEKQNGKEFCIEW